MYKSKLECHQIKIINEKLLVQNETKCNILKIILVLNKKRLSEISQQISNEQLNKNPQMVINKTHQINNQVQKEFSNLIPNKVDKKMNNEVYMKNADSLTPNKNSILFL